MVGAVQYGALAACVVLFVPMVMAGWHLSRNKMLFFSGALFITLAVGVHLTPYFPLISNFVNVNSSHKSPPIVVLENRDSCISLLHNVVYDVKKPNLDNTMDGSDRNVVGSWSWARSDAVVSCGFQKLGRADVSELLNGSWVVVAGDSQARLVVVSLLSLVLRPEKMDSVRVDLFKRHSDYQIVVDEIGMKLDFIWAPYTTNLTDLMIEFKGNKNYPDVLVMGGGLWHMLHVTNSSDYGVSLQSLRNSVVSMFGFSPDELGTDGPVMGSVSIHSPHVYWLGMPVLINSMLNSEEKREKMRDGTRDAYDKELYGSRLLRQSGGPLLLLDIQALSQRCGRQCTVDGMHYGGLVYEAAVHVLLNALLIESHQKL